MSRICHGAKHLSWKVVGEVRAATLATSGLAADDVSAFSLPNDSLPRHTFLHRFGQRWSSISSELSRESTSRRIRYRRFSQLGGLWANKRNSPIALTLIPCRYEKGRHGSGQIDHQFGMPGFRLYSELSLSVRITDFIPYRAKVIHDRLAVSEDSFKNLLLVLMRRQVQILCPPLPVRRELVFYELPELPLIPVSSNDVRNFPLHPAVVHNFLSEPHEICDFQAAAILCRIANQTRLQLFDLLQKGLLILLIEHEIISYS